MKTIGLIGGIGPETTVIYYRLLIASGHTRIVINSVESGVLIPLVVGQDLPAVADFLSADDERAYIHDKYIGELFKGDIRPQTRERLLAIVDAMAARNTVDAVILGGTELSLILTEPEHNGIPLVDTTRIHVDAALARAAS